MVKELHGVDSSARFSLRAPHFVAVEKLTHPALAGPPTGTAL
jgi:hypothetical protein